MELKSKKDKWSISSALQGLIMLIILLVDRPLRHLEWSLSWPDCPLPVTYTNGPVAAPGKYYFQVIIIFSDSINFSNSIIYSNSIIISISIFCISISISRFSSLHWQKLVYQPDDHIYQRVLLSSLETHNELINTGDIEGPDLPRVPSKQAY